jgi:hypothetical protein
VLQHAVEACRRQLEAAQQRLELQAAGAPVTLQADAARIVQIVCNLLGNASKFSPRGSVVTLRVLRETDAVKLTVREHGIGIGAAMLPRLFEMFTQGEPGPCSAKSGLGICLALSRRLAELHGSSVQARSAGPGHGSDFLLRLPVAEAACPSRAENPMLHDWGARGLRVLPPRCLLHGACWWWTTTAAAAGLAELLQIGGHQFRRRTTAARCGRWWLSLGRRRCRWTSACRA